MRRLKFMCELLSDVILNAKATSEGPNKTLDFIPGNNFLGIAAGALYSAGSGLAWTVAHSGKVRFGDAHPSLTRHRGLKVPASMFYPKLSKASEELYIHHRVRNLSDEEIKGKQLKQCRAGFYDFSNTKAKEIKAETSFAIKSAHDKESRRSKDEQMYGYESLQRGLKLYFEIEIDDDCPREVDAKLKEIFKANNFRIGRSRSAQYGRVSITAEEFDEVESKANAGNITEVYADGRLIFLDKYGIPTFRPTPEDLGIQGDAKILWEKSQVRTFQYSPWNYKRSTFDTDRCGIEKGSVFIIEGGTCPSESLYVGSYRNEGFGKVIYNPCFLSADPEGKAEYKLASDSGEAKKQDNIADENFPPPLLNYLKQQKKKEEGTEDIYKKVKDWVEKNGNLFQGGETFASQWGTIRSLAQQAENSGKLRDKLFADGKGYLAHGVAQEKWDDRGRLDKFKKLFDELYEELDESSATEAIVNLASEMAKKCKGGR